MADAEFEEFRYSYENLTSRRRNSSPFFPDLALDMRFSPPLTTEDETRSHSTPICPWTGERRKRKLPKIPNIPNNQNSSPVVVPPYPVEARHPTPQTAPVPAPGPGFATHNPPYPTHTPHPVPVAGFYPLPMGTVPTPYPPMGPTPYPPATGSTPYHPATGSTPYPPVTGATPYPPAGPPYPSTGVPATSAPYHDFSAQPPSYSEAVSQPPVQPLLSKEGYTKQAPYNPNY